jgi:sugar lactone lactonase YvrE
LGQRETVIEFEHGTYPDGLEFDVQGGIWIVSIYSNRVVRIDPEGKATVIIEDFDSDYLDRLEKDFRSGALVDRPAEKVPSRHLGNISSIAFGGADRRTAYLGCLQDTRIATFRSPVAGVAPPHWNFM